jgi:predicted transcriptional regulator
MTTTTLGIKLDEATRDRLKSLAQAKDRAPHWVIKTALLEYLEREEAAERERQEDEARWAHYQAAGQAIEQERVMAWLDQLAEGRRAPCPR